MSERLLSALTELVVVVTLVLRMVYLQGALGRARRKLRDSGAPPPRCECAWCGEQTTAVCVRCAEEVLSTSRSLSDESMKLVRRAEQAVTAQLSLRYTGAGGEAPSASADRPETTDKREREPTP